ncbi:MAG: hypothetical protein R3E50_00605 [Halioglobus sp.]
MALIRIHQWWAVMAQRKRPGRGKRRAGKDRVLQARIPEHLDTVLRDRAESLGLSVSTIVRNTLLHTFDLLEGVVSDSVQISRALQGHAASPRRDKPAPTAVQPVPGNTIAGWQEAVLNLNGVCDQCNAILHKGERAALSLPTPQRPVFLCLECLEGLADPPSKKKSKNKLPAAGRRSRKKPEP